MQLITVDVRSEGGGVLRKIDVNFMDVVVYLIEYDKSKNHAILWGIDPIGRTQFNRLQTAALIDDLQKFGQRLKSHLAGCGKRAETSYLGIV